MKIELYNANCLDVIPTLNYKVDAIICDLPYGTTNCTWDSIIPFEQMWNTLKHVTNKNTPIILFGQEPFSSCLRCANLKDYKYDIYWQKERITNVTQVKRRPGKVIETISVFYSEQCTYNPQMVKYDGPKRGNKVKNGKLGNIIDDGGKKKVTEYVDTGWRYPLQIVQFKRDILTSNLHPTQKPLALMEWLVKTYSNEGDTILDFTMGSGTTGVASKKLNRNFVGIELDKDYFRIAKDRIENEI